MKNTSETIKIGIVDLSGKILFRKIWKKEEDWIPHELTEEMLRCKLQEVLEESKLHPIGLGLGVSGLIDRSRQSIRYCPNLAQLRDVNVHETFGIPLRLPVCLLLCSK